MRRKGDIQDCLHSATAYEEVSVHVAPESLDVYTYFPPGARFPTSCPGAKMAASLVKSELDVISRHPADGPTTSQSPPPSVDTKMGPFMETVASFIPSDEEVIPRSCSVEVQGYLGTEKCKGT